MKNDLCSCKGNSCNCIGSLKKIQDFNNGIWTSDLVILVQCSNELSYKATNAASWSIMCSYVPVELYKLR